MEEQKHKFDVVIIGAGIAGATAARELSKYNLSVAVLEKNSDVCFGSTKGTHGVVHCGFPAGIHTPLRNRGELRGNLIMEELCKDLDVPFKRIGKLLVSFNQKELDLLKIREKKARWNGVQGVKLITDLDLIREMEPNISSEVIAALYTPSTAITSPWDLVFALMENAIENGVQLFVNTEVEGIEERGAQGLVINTNKGPFKTEYIVNAAGLYADRIASLVGDESFSIYGSRQQRIIFDKQCEGMVKHLVRSLNAKGAVGDFVCPTTHGNILIGVKVDTGDYLGDVKTTRDGLEDWVVPQGQRLIPSLNAKYGIKSFAGYIPMPKWGNAAGDYYIKPAPRNSKFVNLVLGGSGFSASPAMAEYLVLEVLPAVGLKLEEKGDFKPNRKKIPCVHEMDNQERVELINSNPMYGHIVCRCETISEGEVVEAIKRGATTVDGVKFRTRSGMGRCQGGFCRPHILKIISRELDKKVKDVTMNKENSFEVLFESKELLLKHRSEAVK